MIGQLLVGALFVAVLTIGTYALWLFARLVSAFEGIEREYSRRGERTGVSEGTIRENDSERRAVESPKREFDLER